MFIVLMATLLYFCRLVAQPIAIKVLRQGQSISAKVRFCAKIGQGGAFGGSKYGERFAGGMTAQGGAEGTWNMTVAHTITKSRCYRWLA